MLSHMAQKYRLPVAYVNQVGGNDDLIFDGRSCAFDSQGRMLARAKGFEEDILIVDLSLAGESQFKGPSRPTISKPRPRSGTRWCWACAITSRKTAILQGAAGTLGRHRFGAHRRHRRRSHGTGKCPRRPDAVALFERRQRGRFHGAGAQSRHPHPDSAHREIMQTYDGVLGEAFRGRPADVTEENIQSRIRGNLLMALSNKFGSLLLTTGNKSEMSVGYCTLYGDMNGGLAVIADLPKMMVYRVSRWRNRVRPRYPGKHSDQGAFR